MKKAFHPYKKTHFFAILFISFSQISFGQELSLDWHKRISGPVDNIIHSSILDDDGNIYLTGRIRGKVDLDPGSDTFCVSTSTNQNDAFVAKMNPSGEFIWGSTIGGDSGDFGDDIAVDNHGNVYVLGHFSSTAYFYPDTSQLPIVSNGHADVFIQKLDSNGNILWVKTIGGPNYDWLASLTLDSLGNIYLTGQLNDTIDFDPGLDTLYLSPVDGDDIVYMKLDTDGELVWAKSFPGYFGSGWDYGNVIKYAPSGYLYLAGAFEGLLHYDTLGGISSAHSHGSTDAFLCKMNDDGEVIWLKSFGGQSSDNIQSIAIDHSENIYVTGQHYGTADLLPGPQIQYVGAHGYTDVFLSKFDSSGTFIWGHSVGGEDWDYADAVATDDYGNVYCMGSYDDHLVYNHLDDTIFAEGSSDIFIQKRDSNGLLLWINSMGGVAWDGGTTMNITKENNIFMSMLIYGGLGFYLDLDPGPINTNTQYPFSPDILFMEFTQNRILGRVYNDFQQTCQPTTNSVGLEGRRIIVNPGNYVSMTNGTGLWVLDSLPTGTYTATIDTSGTWVPTCPSVQTFTVTNPRDITVVPHFGLVSTAPCPAPDISIFAPFLRPGFSNQKVYVNLSNAYTGTAILSNAYVIVELDSLLTVNNISQNYTQLSPTSYQISIGDINPGSSQYFWLDCTLSLNAFLGQNLCMNATLFPVDTCFLDTIPNPFPNNINPCNTLYDYSHLVIRPDCNNDTICFTITNTGDGHMNCYSQVRLFVDGQLTSLDSVILVSGDTAIFAFLGDGRTWRLEVDQHPLHPGNSQPSATIELCGNLGAWSPDYFNVLPHNDANPHVDIYCGQVTGSYDPNDKTGFPLGWGAHNNIDSGQALEYLIRFQNTGNDTAFTVVIRDTLSMDLDIFSVSSGASSHDYTFRMYGPRVLEWTFNNIMLPDSNVNESASHGFVSFKVDQTANLPLGTLIENSAAIYFDFNAPIITNQTQHTINERILTISVDKVELGGSNILVYPNPFSEYTTIEVQDHHHYLEFNLFLYDLMGRQVEQVHSSFNKIHLQKGKKKSGMYLFELYGDGKKIAIGKVVVN